MTTAFVIIGDHPDFRLPKFYAGHGRWEESITRAQEFEARTDAMRFARSLEKTAAYLTLQVSAVTYATAA